MNKNETTITNHCDFSNIRPAIVALPYPPIQVMEKNLNYANLLSIDYCGAVSELSSITQYINNENRLSCQHCPTAKVILGIAMAEMMHLQMLGELICLLGGKIDFMSAQQNGKQKLWTPAYLNLPEQERKMILVNIQGEKEAIHQYKMHINSIKDIYVNAVLMRIIKDEEYHIMMLQALLEQEDSVQDK